MRREPTAFVLVVTMVACFAARVVGGDSPDSAMPPAAAGILLQMDKEIAASKAKAATALDKVLRDTTKRGDLAGAVAVKETIDQLRADAQGDSRTRSGVMRGNANSIVGTWSDGHNTLEFLADGSCSSAGQKASWQLEGNAVTMKWSFGYSYRLAMKPEGLVGTKFDAKGQDAGPIRLTRVP
jgi:hypothetical protein